MAALGDAGAARLYAAFTGPKGLASFTAAEGASMHGETMSRTLDDRRMVD